MQGFCSSFLTYWSYVRMKVWRTRPGGHRDQLPGTHWDEQARKFTREAAGTREVTYQEIAKHCSSPTLQVLGSKLRYLNFSKRPKNRATLEEMKNSR